LHTFSVCTLLTTGSDESRNFEREGHEPKTVADPGILERGAV